MIEKFSSGLTIDKAAQLLNVRRQGYYEYKNRKESLRAQMEKVMLAKIENIFYESERIYGARKIRAKLEEMGYTISRKRVRKLMLIGGMVPISYRKRINTTDSRHSQEVFPNLLKQNFHVDKPNAVWVSDFTYIATDEGWYYLCSVIDLFSRRVVGWAVSETIDKKLALAAFEDAVNNRNPGKGLIVHTDRGSQYASSDFRNAVERVHGIQSMSRPGTPYDNACAESFFKAIKVECLSRTHFSKRLQAKSAIRQYMFFYNRSRIHQSLGYMTPADFEHSLLDSVC